MAPSRRFEGECSRSRSGTTFTCLIPGGPSEEALWAMDLLSEGELKEGHS